MQRIIVSSFIFLSILFIFSACQKGAGPGGRASIKGKVFARNYNNSYIKTDSGYIAGQKVFIKYGDIAGVGDNVDTDLNGEFVFPYLRKGNYTVYILSKRLYNNTLDTTVSQTVSIEDRKEVKTLPLFEINTFKN